MRLRRFPLSLALLAMAGCKSPDQKLASDLTQLSTALATMQSVEHSWQNGTVPEHYRRRVLELVTDEVKTRESSIATNESSLAPEARAATTAAGLTLQQMQSGKTQAAEALAPERRQIEALESRAEKRN